MYRYETKMVEKKILVGITCDTCGSDDNGSRVRVETDSVYVEHKNRGGDRFFSPYLNNTPIKSFDLCADCATKFWQALDAAGVNPK